MIPTIVWVLLKLYMHSMYIHWLTLTLPCIKNHQEMVLKLRATKKVDSLLVDFMRSEGVFAFGWLKLEVAEVVPHERGG